MRTTTLATNRFPIRATLLAVAALLALAACNDRDPVSAARPALRRAALVDETGNARLVVGVDAPDVWMLSVEIGAADLKEPLAWKFAREGEGALFGAVAVPPGEGRAIVVHGFDAEGRERYAGETKMDVGKELTPQLRFALRPADEALAKELGLVDVEAWAGSFRVALDPAVLPEPNGDPVKITMTVLDPDGQPMPLDPEGLEWVWPREVGELEVVYGGLDAMEALGVFTWIDPRQPVQIVVCDTLRHHACGKVPSHDFPGALVKYVKVVGGAYHTCALDTLRRVKCWGANGSGQLGIDAGGVSRIGGAWADVSAGAEHTCALDMQGTAWCWGANAKWQLGRTTNWGEGDPVPQPVLDGHVFTQIAAGGRHTCALDTAGDIWCWGDWTWGQLGDGVFHNYGGSEHPQLVYGGYKWSAVVSGEYHSCGITGGDVRCWGDNSRGQTGVVWNTDTYSKCHHGTASQTYDCSRRPAGPGGFYDVVAMSAGGSRNCALTSSGEIWCWGAAWLGANTTTVDDLNPLMVAGGHRFTAVGVGKSHSCGVADDGNVWCWGEGTYGQRGDGTNVSVQRLPVQVAGMTAPWASTLGLGFEHSCAVSADQAKLLCWGKGWSGQLGTSLTDPTRPEVVTVF